MEGSDENNRSLLLNPFVSMVLIHFEQTQSLLPPAPLPHPAPSSPIVCTSRSQHINNWQHPWNQYPDSRAVPGHRQSSSIANTQLTSTLSFILPPRPHPHTTASGNESTVFGCFVRLCKPIFFLTKLGGNTKALLPLCCIVCYSEFVLATVHVLEALERSAVRSLRVFLCHGLVYEL